MKVVEINFVGGIGNQLFQYATARALLRKGDQLLFNISSYNEDYLGRQFELLNYKVHGSLIKKRWLKKAFIPDTKFNILLNKLGLYSFIKENGFFIHNELKFKTKFFTRIFGFWQSEIYFSNIRIALINEITLKSPPPLPKIFSLENTVAVHVRRTDYLYENRYGFIGENYYRKAINLVKKKVNNPKFIIFSDDINWCKSTFIEESISFCEYPDWSKDYHQLYLMSHCWHQIIANSSFSWWGAWLNRNPSKIVIRPFKSFNDPSLLYENYYPLNWVAL